MTGEMSLRICAKIPDENTMFSSDLRTLLAVADPEGGGGGVSPPP